MTKETLTPSEETPTTGEQLQDQETHTAQSRNADTEGTKQPEPDAASSTETDADNGTVQDTDAADEGEHNHSPELDGRGLEAAVSKARDEAAKYRVRLREAEEQRDTLQEQVTSLQMQVAESCLPKNLQPKLFWFETDLKDLLDENGRVDLEKTIQQAKEVAAEHHVLISPGFGETSIGTRPQSAPEHPAGWSRVFQGNTAYSSYGASKRDFT